MNERGTLHKLGNTDKIKVDMNTSDAELWVSVRDKGLGILANDLPYIFDKFYRVTAKTASIFKEMGWDWTSSSPLWSNMAGR